jgi:plasmid stabilization system protein ParE
MKQVVVLAEAAEDIEQARDFYEAQKVGLGDCYSDSLLIDLGRLALNHGVHPRRFGLYRMLAHRFPFGIYYRESGTETQVLAVLDLRRDPNWIRRELEDRG